MKNRWEKQEQEDERKGRFHFIKTKSIKKENNQRNHRKQRPKKYRDICTCLGYPAKAKRGKKSRDEETEARGRERRPRPLYLIYSDKEPRETFGPLLDKRSFDAENIIYIYIIYFLKINFNYRLGGFFLFF